MNRLILIDSHPLLYRSYYSPGTRSLKTSTGILSGGFFGFIRSYLTLCSRFPKSHFIFCFDSGASWRNKIYRDYKSPHLPGTLEGFDEQLSNIKSFIWALDIPVFIQARLEADDLISVCACEWVTSVKDGTAVIVSSDRDFFQLVSERISCYDDRAKTFYGPAEVEAKTGVKPKHIVNYKALVGDVSDNITGVKGFGPKKAAQLVRYNSYDGILTVDELSIVHMNKQLIDLPKSLGELSIHLSRSASIRISDRLEEVFNAFENNILGKINVFEIERLLKLYEVKTININSFGD